MQLHDLWQVSNLSASQYRHAARKIAMIGLNKFIIIISCRKKRSDYVYTQKRPLSM